MTRLLGWKDSIILVGNSACIFCGGYPMNREHLIPEWIARALGVVRIDVEQRHDDLRSSWGACDSFGLTITCTCERCNSGWMSRLETDVKPFLEPLLFNRVVAFGPKEQRMLAAWFWKVALVANERLQVPFFTVQDARAFYEARQPPDSARIWIGRLPPGGEMARLSQEILPVGQGATRIGRQLVLTLSLGRVVLQLLSVSAGRLNAPPRAPRSALSLDETVVQFWPDVSETNRLPVLVMQHRHFAAFTHRFDPRAYWHAE